MWNHPANFTYTGTNTTHPGSSCVPVAGLSTRTQVSLGRIPGIGVSLTFKLILSTASTTVSPVTVQIAYNSQAVANVSVDLTAYPGMSRCSSTSYMLTIPPTLVPASATNSNNVLQVSTSSQAYVSLVEVVTMY